MKKGIIAIGIAVGCLLLVILILRKSHSVNTITQENVNGLYRTLYFFDKIMTENGIPYFISCGTLLGAIRNGGLIPWDNDIDIGMQSEDISRLLALKDEFAKHGITLPKTDSIQRVDSGTGFLDIFPYIRNSNGEYVHEDEYNRKRFDKEWFTSSNLYPLKRYTFGPLSVLGPNEGEICVERMYGSDWRTPVSYAKAETSFFSYFYRNMPITEKKMVALPSIDYLN
jgi:phosphorylcholine metabolism protein LicD